MTTIAYIANQFPSPIEPYVMDEIGELRSRGVHVVCCSGKRAPSGGLGDREREFREETTCFQPLSDTQLLRAARRLGSDTASSSAFLKPIFRELPVLPARRIRSLAHTLMGAALADELTSTGVDHIHAHHGYFASWMALVAARLLRIGFSFTLHGSDLLVRADLLSAKLQACRFCVTVSEFNRDYILKRFPATPASKIVVQRLGVDPVPLPECSREKQEPRKFCLLAVGRLHCVKNHKFLLQGCAALRDAGVDFVCWIAGEGPERPVLERQIDAMRLHGRVLLVGHVTRAGLDTYYRHADLVALTSLSEGLPVVLMEAMAHGKLVIAPAITGIPELVEHGRTGFLYPEGSLHDFVDMVQWIANHRETLQTVGHAAHAHIAVHYDRQRNLRQFADRFLDRIEQPESSYANSLLQQVQLPV